MSVTGPLTYKIRTGNRKENKHVLDYKSQLVFLSGECIIAQEYNKMCGSSLLRNSKVLLTLNGLSLSKSILGRKAQLNNLLMQITWRKI